MSRQIQNWGRIHGQDLRICALLWKYKYGVDLVLFGDEHVYKVYDNYNNFSQVAASKSGTYYFEQVATSTYYNYREGTVAVSSKITVNNKSISISMYVMRGDVVNQKILYPRRPATKDIIEFWLVLIDECLR